MKRVIGKGPSAMAPVSLVKNEEEDSQSTMFAEMEKIFSVGSHSDALKIFYATKEGIDSSTKAIKELNLTPKRYYTHLKALIDAGLIGREENIYKHTTLGRVCFKLMEALRSTISQRDRLDLVDRVKKAKDLSLEETEEIMRAILKDANIAPGERIADFLGPVRMADTWEKVVSDVIEYLEGASESVYFATQHFDMKVAEAVLGANERGLKMYFLTNKIEQASNKLKFAVQSLFASPRTLRSLFKVLDSPEFHVRFVNVPYSFIVIDEKIAMVEVTEPLTNAFSLAFFFFNERLCRKLVDSFFRLWEKSTETKTWFDKILKQDD